jgi:osmotically-inducible protein OsmY
MKLPNLLFFAIVSVAVQGCVNGVSNSVERRSPGTQLEDESIETKAVANIKDKYKESAQITVTSFNRFVLITGDAPNEEVKAGIERIVYSVLNVKKIANEVSVGALSNPSVRRTDAGITRDIKSSFNRKQLSSGTVKITTERGVVYLLGLVTHADADAASEIASTANGVQKVVRVFEYID